MKCCLTEEGLGILDEIDLGCPYAQDIRRRRAEMGKVVLTTQLRRVGSDTRQVSNRSRLDARAPWWEEKETEKKEVA